MRITGSLAKIGRVRMAFGGRVPTRVATVIVPEGAEGAGSYDVTIPVGAGDDVARQLFDAIRRENFQPGTYGLDAALGAEGHFTFGSYDRTEGSPIVRVVVDGVFKVEPAYSALRGPDVTKVMALLATEGVAMTITDDGKPTWDTERIGEVLAERFPHVHPEIIQRKDSASIHWRRYKPGEYFASRGNKRDDGADRPLTMRLATDDDEDGVFGGGDAGQPNVVILPTLTFAPAPEPKPIGQSVPRHEKPEEAPLSGLAKMAADIETAILAETDLSKRIALLGQAKAAGLL